MNEFNVRCPGCDSEYDETTMDGFRKLIHKGVSLAEGLVSLTKLPSWRCIAIINYVGFHQCGHCCPESFADCPKCNNGKPGKTLCG